MALSMEGAARLLVATLVVLTASCAGGPGNATTNFHGKTVRILVGVSAGGGYDLYARILAPHLGRHLPGQPHVVVENMVGAGGLVAANYLAHQAPRDGTVIALLGGQALVSQVIADPAVRYDVKAFELIGSPSPDEGICVAAPGQNLDLSSWRLRKAMPPRFGATNYGSTAHVYGALLAATLDLPIRFIVGYRGSAEMRAALENGELEGLCIGLDAYRASFMPTERYPVLLRTEADTDPDLQGVPAAATLVQASGSREWLDLLRLIAAASRLYVLPPNTPDAIRAVIRHAFDSATNDSAFLAAAAAARLTIQPIGVAALEKNVSALLDLPADARARLVALVSQSARPE